MKIDISMLKNGQMIQGFLAVDTVETKMARNNKGYMNLVLSDGKLSIAAKKWDHSPTDPLPTSGSVIKVQGSVGEYQSSPQLVVDRWRNVQAGDGVESADFIKRSQIVDEELWATSMKYISLIQDTDYHNLVRHIYGKYKDLIMTAPSALRHHQAFVAGNIEHTNAVTRLALIMASERSNLSLLIAGAMLHDIGKIFTYRMDGLAVAMTDAGKLLDHIVIGTSLIMTEATAIGTPMSKVTLLLHIIASHHGHKEWGSPVVPMFEEAFLVHEADKVHVTTTKLEAIACEANPEDKWSPYHKDLGTGILCKFNDEYPVDPLPSFEIFADVDIESAFAQSSQMQFVKNEGNVLIVDAEEIENE